MNILNILSIIEVVLPVIFAAWALSGFVVFYIASKSSKAFLLYDPKPFRRISFKKLNTVYSLLNNEAEKRKFKILIKYYSFQVYMMYTFYAVVFIWILLLMLDKSSRL